MQLGPPLRQSLATVTVRFHARFGCKVRFFSSTGDLLPSGSALHTMMRNTASELCLRASTASPIEAAQMQLLQQPLNDRVYRQIETFR